MPVDNSRVSSKEDRPLQGGNAEQPSSLTAPASAHQLNNKASVVHGLQAGKKGRWRTSLCAADKKSSVVGLLDFTGSLHIPNFSPYGFCPSLPSMLGFDGQRADSVTGHYPLGNGYRLFMPSLMRFNRPDSMSPFNAGGMNAYAYCRGDPASWQDADGHVPTQPKLGARGHTFSRPVTASSLPDRVLSYPTVEEHVVNLVSYDYSKAKHALRAKMVVVSEHPSDVPEEYTLIAFHGSGRQHSRSLSTGINSERLRRGVYGPGFYTSPDPEVAVVFSRRYGLNRQVFGVYAKDVHRWVEGKDYEYPRANWLKILEPAYKNVVIRQEIKMPVRILNSRTPSRTRV